MSTLQEFRLNFFQFDIVLGAICLKLTTSKNLLCTEHCGSGYFFEEATHLAYMGSDGLMHKVSASQPRDRGFEPHTGHDHDSSYDTSTGWFQEAKYV